MIIGIIIGIAIIAIVVVFVAMLLMATATDEKTLR